MRIPDWEGYVFLVKGCNCSGPDKAYIFAKSYETAVTTWIERCADKQADGGCGCSYMPASIKIVGSMGDLDFDAEASAWIGAAVNALVKEQHLVNVKEVVGDDEITADHLADLHARAVEQTQQSVRDMLTGMIASSDEPLAKAALGRAIDLLG